MNLPKHISTVYPAEHDSYSIILLASHPAERMKSFEPKSLLKLDGKISLLEYQLGLLTNRFRNREIILVCGVEADKLMNNSPAVVKIHNENYETTGLSRSVALGLRASTQPNVIVISADLFFNHEIFDVMFADEAMIFHSSDGQSTDHLGCNLCDGNVEFIMYGTPNQFANIVYLTGKELKRVQRLVFNRDNDNLMWFEILNQAIDEGGRFKAVNPKNSRVKHLQCIKDVKEITL